MTIEPDASQWCPLTEEPNNTNMSTPIEYNCVSIFVAKGRVKILLPSLTTGHRYRSCACVCCPRLYSRAVRLVINVVRVPAVWTEAWYQASLITTHSSSARQYNSKGLENMQSDKLISAETNCFVPVLCTYNVPIYCLCAFYDISQQLPQSSFKNTEYSSKEKQWIYVPPHWKRFHILYILNYAFFWRAKRFNLTILSIINR